MQDHISVDTTSTAKDDELLNSWPFRDIDPKEFYNLTLVQKSEIQGAVRLMLLQFKPAS